MAEALLNGVLSVLSKLAEFTVVKAVEKFHSIYKINEEVKKLSKELEYIMTFIKDIDLKYVADKVQMQYVRDAMDIAYDIEDAIDIFLLECPEKSLEECIEKSPGIMDRLKDLAKKTTQFPFLSNFEAEIRRIQKRISEMEDYREKYQINIFGEDVGGEKKRRKSSPEDKLDPIGDPEIVGYAKDRDNIIKRLCDNENQSLDVVSIVGPGGIGKSTLAQKVCNSNDVIENFGKPIWITISQKYNLLDILRKIAQNLNIESTSLNSNELANQIWLSLKKRTYLIVFDDVWTEELWYEIVKVLPDTGNGSRILMTTRSTNVAQRANTTYDPYELQGLDIEQSVKLFLKKAVPKKHQRPDSLFVDLHDIVKKFVAKCMDTKIEAKPLIRLWVAEGLIPHEERRSLEETAECFLEDLVQRSMIQVLERYPDGSIKSCWVHDVLRDLAIQKAKEINFLTVCSRPNDWESCRKSFKESPHLKYLRINTDCIWKKEREFGEWVSGMKYLETLDLRSSLHGPPALADLINLQTLRDVTYNESWEPSVLPNIPKVRQLGIHIDRKTEREAAVMTLFGKLKHVVYLKIQGDVIDLQTIGRGGFPFYKNLKSLVLIYDQYGHADTDYTLNLDYGMLPPHLTELQFRGYQFGSDPMPVLEKLGSLNTLWIGETSEEKNLLMISCSDREFKQLEVLVLENFKMLKEWKIETGAMPMLKQLRVSSCPLLNVPSKLIHLDSLECLDWKTHHETNADAINNIFIQRPHMLRLTIIEDSMFFPCI
ncbi:hypothetical protein LUZ61_008808 [Rhynchospora tenuis]|uniref:NB-ARC domain-containing protein n=1 Tax=Rhynchospora tenuis TaxID=198213 RepID=A0AAD6EY06_9POAL|nr:hypothetical protein LUZ61_008808 [Rhynchospora tenuis]